MNCRTCEGILNACMDQELEAPALVLLQGHLRDCPKCRQDGETLQALQAQLRRPELRVSAPAALRQQIQERLGAERKMAMGRINPRRRRPALKAAAVVATVGVLWLAQPWGGHGSGERGLAQELAALHSRSLAPEPSLGIKCSDAMTLRSWLADQVGFAVPVENPTGKGFSLEGARVDQVGKRRVAVLVYRGEGHVLTLFVWPRATPPRLKEAMYTERGYRVMHWDEGNVTCWAVSDVSAHALHRFCDALGG